MDAEEELDDELLEDDKDDDELDDGDEDDDDDSEEDDDPDEELDEDRDEVELDESEDDEEEELLLLSMTYAIGPRSQTVRVIPSMSVVKLVERSAASPIAGEPALTVASESGSIK